jgi:uncharacterized protein
MKYMMVIFIIIFFSLYGGLSYYIGLRGWQGIGSSIPMLNSRIYWIIFWIASISYILAQLLERYLPLFLSETFEVIGGYWMAAMFYLLLVLPIIDLIRLLNRRIRFLPERFTQNESTALMVSVFVLISLTLLMIYGTWSGRSPRVSKYDIHISKEGGKPDKLKVVMVSDIHLGNIIDNSRLTVMVDRINELEPDLVLIPGDIIDSRLEPFTRQRMAENFRRLKTRYGVFASLGNHDGMGGSADDTTREFENAGMRVLRDEVLLINDSFYIIGRDDPAVFRGRDGKRKDLAEILEGVDRSKPIMLMDHQPRELDAAEKEGIDLQVSGHTHRGQFFPNNLITNKIFEVDYGYLKKGNFNTIVSSGFGTWGPPIRIGSRSEIVEIRISINK